MAYNQQLAERIRKITSRIPGITEKRMFGSLIFLKHGRISVGVMKDLLLVKIRKEDFEKLVAKPHVAAMQFGEKSIKGFIRISAKGYASGAALASWVKRGFATADGLGPKTAKELAQAKKNVFTVSSLKDIEDIIHQFPSDIQAVTEAVREVVKGEGFPFLEKANPGWRAITYRHESAGYVCGIFPLKGRVRLVFEHGARIKDTKHILQSGSGTLKQIRYIEFHTVEEVEKMAHAIGDFIRLAMSVRKKKPR